MYIKSNSKSSGKKRYHDSTYHNEFNKVPRHSVGTGRTELNKEPLKTPAMPKSLTFLQLCLIIFFKSEISNSVSNHKSLRFFVRDFY